MALIVPATATVSLTIAEEPAPMLEIGSPPLPIDLGAQGQRAPPLPA